MSVPAVARDKLVVLAAPLCALVLAGCASTTSTSGFKGEKHEVAQAIANLQSNATSGDESKICASDLASSIVTRLGGSKGCEAAIKRQLTEVDSLELTVESISMTGASASASVKSVHEGKKKDSTVALVKEGKAWKISALG
jgi:outer membrane murein-binding lipoprotein Lpp